MALMVDDAVLGMLKLVDDAVQMKTMKYVVVD